jgi:bacterioferritin-associated ferredoxin
MYVCICHAVTDRTIREVVDRGARSLLDVQCELPVGSCCGRCQETAEQVVEECLRARGKNVEQQPEPLEV